MSSLGGTRQNEHVRVRQDGATKWENTSKLLRAACEHDEVSDDFWLFNDDFFVLRPVDGLPPMYHGTLAERIRRIEERFGGPSRYGTQLAVIERMLKTRGLGTLDYSLHVPMPVNKEKALVTMDEFSSPMFRSLYGNRHAIGGVDVPDVKLYGLFDVPPDGAILASTVDMVFSHGAGGVHIRGMFPDKCRYEV